MPTMSDRFSVPANTVSKGRFAGQVHEYVQQHSVINVYATASAIGLNLTISNGEEVLVADQEVNAQNRLPLRPDDLFTSYGALPGDRIIIDWRNTTGAAITGFLVVDIIPV